MPTFSPQLIERIQRRFVARHGRELTQAQAVEYLHSLADLFLLFAKLPERPDLQNCNAGLPPSPLEMGSKHRVNGVGCTPL
jgi:hypothetical protein